MRVGRYITHIQAGHLLLDVVHHRLQRGAVARLPLLTPVVHVLSLIHI
jgi:hypothetical protein